MAIAHDLTDRIDDLLPQTQCGKCGYKGCRPYAEAIAAGQAEINQCPPGGALGIQYLAALLDRPVLPLNPANGKEQPRLLALIDEAICIGCTKCIQACPVDAIVGAAKLMHSVIVDECTGCELCLPPCPVDCITLVPAPCDLPQRSASQLRRRHQNRLRRLAQEEGARTATRRHEVLEAVVSKKSVLEAIARGKEKKFGK